MSHSATNLFLVIRIRLRFDLALGIYLVAMSQPGRATIVQRKIEKAFHNDLRRGSLESQSSGATRYG